MSKRIYLAGPISNVSDYEYKFNSVEMYLRNKYPAVEVVNPVTIALNFSKKLRKSYDEIPYEEFFRQDINELMRCDTIFMLKGWEHSKGASAEHAVAFALDLEISYQ